MKNNIARYWKNSISDADLLSLQAPVILKGIPITLNEIITGKLNSDIVQVLFKNSSKNENYVGVDLTPLIFEETATHGRQKDNIIFPIHIKTKLHRDGTLSTSQYVWIPRNVLQPLEGNENLSIGDITDYDTFISSNQLDNKIAAKKLETMPWESTIAFASDMLLKVTGMSLIDFTMPNFSKHEVSRVTKSNLMSVIRTPNNIEKLYSDILDKKNLSLPLFERLVNLEDAYKKPLLTKNQGVKLSYSHHLGQMGAGFPLSKNQRESVRHFFSGDDGDILAVNGPPGTGKTTLIHSIIASLWVSAAIENKAPPIIVAASTNNQAVQNIIESFGSIQNGEQSFFEKNAGDNFYDSMKPLMGRWINGIKSYGLYGPSKDNIKDIYQNYIDGTRQDEFHRTIESVDFKLLELNFLEKAKEYFPSQNNLSIQHVVDNLQSEIKKTSVIIEECMGAYYYYQKEVDSTNEQGGMNKIKFLMDQSNSNLLTVETKMQLNNELLKEFDKHISEESLLFTLLPNMGFSKKMVALKNKAFLRKHEVSTDNLSNFDNDSVMTFLESKLKRYQEKKKADEKKLTELTKSVKYYDAALTKKNKFLSKLKISSATPIETLDDFFDTHHRFFMFKLATHYWEGRWLLTIKERKSDKRESWPSQLIGKWQRYSMLTPCFVSTFHQTPKHFSAWKDYTDHPLYNTIDLLIVDEAGQVSPEIGGASFSLAKRALVVGDQLQIEPVQSSFPLVDMGNMRDNHLYDDFLTPEIDDKGISVTNGNIMKICQRASQYEYNKTFGGGMFLSEHRRCQKELISYCNDLCYKGFLEPQRENDDNASPFPRFGFAHIPSESKQVDGSRINESEAYAIAIWVRDHASLIEEFYGKRLKDLLAIVTPFAKQSELIKSYLRKELNLDITVGTVHSLQGSERNIVIFSSTYGENDKGSSFFFDQGPNMLNVAVSRAKDSFLVFGDMNIFDQDSSTPSGILARYLYRKETNELTNIFIPKRNNFNIEPHAIQTLEGHRKELKNVFENAQSSIVLISPFLTEHAIVEDNIVDLIKIATDRDVRVFIFFDIGLNMENNEFKKSARAALKLLKETKAKLSPVKGVHSKNIFVDDDVMYEGSFNWLSTRRNGPFKRLETTFYYRSPNVKEYKNNILKKLKDIYNYELSIKLLKSI